MNKRVKLAVDEVLAKSDQPPIIIIQGDHGSASTFYTDEKGGWHQPTSIQLKERMRILNAYYLPKGRPDELGPDFTPVNTFRLILNEYLNADLKLLPNYSYFSNYVTPYQFKNVTKEVIFK